MTTDYSIYYTVHLTTDYLIHYTMTTDYSMYNDNKLLNSLHGTMTTD